MSDHRLLANDAMQAVAQIIVASSRSSAETLMCSHAASRLAITFPDGMRL